MKGLLALVAAVATAVACGPSAATTPAPAAPVEQAAPTPAGGEGHEAEAATTFLWKVTSTSGKTLHLFGSLHTGGAARVPAPAWVALAASSGMVLEAEMSIDPNAIAARALMPEGQSLHAMLGDANWTRLVAIIGDILPEASLDRIQPWYATAAVLQKSLAGEPVDGALLAKAKELGKPLHYLETYEVQLQALEVAFDIGWLKRILADPTAIPRAVEAVVSAYNAGDLDAFARASTDPHLLSPRQYELVVQKRNRSWLPLLEQHLAEGGRFVSVGASQLVGAGGLLELLEARGHTVERIAAD